MLLDLEKLEKKGLGDSFKIHLMNLAEDKLKGGKRNPNYKSEMEKAKQLYKEKGQDPEFRKKHGFNPRPKKD